MDGSLFGMGRGAGNAKTELLADYINKHCGGHYNLQKLLGTIDKYITPVLKDVHWGYDLPMYVCGTKHSHVDNVYHLEKTYGCTANEMFDIIDALLPQQRTGMEQDTPKQIFPSWIKCMKITGKVGNK